MLRFVIRKMISKKWMVIALLIGNILLVGITASNPMYTQAVLQRTLLTSLNDYLEQKNRYPGAVTIKASGAVSRNPYVVETIGVAQGVGETYGLPVYERAAHYSLGAMQTVSNLERDDRTRTTLTLGALTDLDSHSVLVAGTGCSDQPDENGVIDVVVSERGLIEMGLILGEELTFPKIANADGSALTVRVTGVFKNSDPSDPYWVQAPSAFTTELFMSGDLFASRFLTGDMPYGVTASWYELLDYTAMRVDQVPKLLEVTNQYAEYFDDVPNQSFSTNFSKLLIDFQKTQSKVIATLWILQAPIFVLLAAFIFMVSRQMLDMEQGEIAVLKSRGAGRGQIIAVYFIQSAVTALLALAAGLPLGAFLVRVLGSANAFLEFVKRSALTVEVNREALIYAGAASVLSVGAMVLPVLGYSRVGIVAHKQKKSRSSGRPLWEKLFLDFAALGVSLYGLYTFGNQRASLAQRVLDGESLDPLLFLSSSLFMLGAGLVALRILPLLIRLIFTLFKKRWSPALYAAFLRVLRTRGQQSFIMIFLIMTIALGVFDASAARTINMNEERNLRYMTGADIVLQEKWEDNSALLIDNPDSSGEIEYREPDFGRYATLEGAESMTRVLVMDDGAVSVSGGTLKDIQIMGINTKEFGETAWFDESLLPEHWYEYLNVLSQKATAVLLSSNFRDDYGYRIGDSIYFRGGSRGSMRGVIYGFVDYWPGYAATTYSRNSSGLYAESKHYLIVANLAQLQSVWGVTPYQIWIKAPSSRFVYDFAEENGLSYLRFDDVSAELVALKNDPLIQGTNGILTVGFIVVLTLCAVGFLIYWVLSIRSRALQFGIFRAMGMSMREIVSMLICEHLFISGAAIGTGALVGVLTARLYMPLIQIAYSSSDSALPLMVTGDPADGVRLAVIVTLMIGVCLFVLGWLIGRMKIAQALKLGED